MPGNKKKLSIITPLYNTPKHYLDDVLECVQPYADEVELVLVNDSPNNQRLARWLKQITQPHVVKLVNERNMGIFAAYCNGFLHASGEYCCILDHDDVFNPQFVLPAIEEAPDLIYTNEYKFYDGENGEKVVVETYCKPDFDVLSSVFYFYTHHVTVLKTSIVQHKLRSYSGGKTYTSIFDIHMLLEYLTAFTGREIKVIHVPEAAYGWRIHRNSTASSLEQKLTSYFERMKKTEEFLRQYGEVPLLNIDKNIGYLVEGEFLSVWDMVPFPLAKEKFREELVHAHGYEGEHLCIRLLDGQYTDDDYEHFCRILLRLPIKYLKAQKCFPLLIPSVEDTLDADPENTNKHVPNVPFLARTENIKSGLLLWDRSENTQNAKYAVLIR